MLSFLVSLSSFIILSVAQAEELRVATLNIGHGRGAGVHQALQSRNRVSVNIDEVAGVLQGLELDVLALQEADTSAWWSGHNNQVVTLSETLQLNHSVVGAHSQKQRLEYGTSLLTSIPLIHDQSIVYRSSFPLPSKGFVFGVVQFQGRDIGIASVHLDPLKPKVRRLQMQRLTETVMKQEIPLVVMGDFNLEWGEELQTYCDTLGLKAHQPETQLVSFPKLQRRLDWILVSSEFVFTEYETLAPEISDHKVVTATIAFQQQD